MPLETIAHTVCAYAQVCFDRPGVAEAIFLFLASDGLAPGKRQQSTVTLYLVDVSGSNHSVGELRITSLEPLVTPIDLGVSLMLTSENVCSLACHATTEEINRRYMVLG